MHTDFHKLRLSRKQSSLTQTDISFLLELSDDTSVCRWETGLRKPKAEFLLAYHLLFAIPIGPVYEPHMRTMVQVLIKRMALLAQELKRQPQNYKVRNRIQFLEAAITRLNS